MSTSVAVSYSKSMRFLNLAIYLLLLVVGTYFTFRPTFDSGFDRMQTDYGDTVLNHYILEHSFQSLFTSGYRGTLLSPPFYYPHPLVLGYSENLLGAAPVYWGLRSFLPYDLAYQWWMIVLVVLDFALFALVARWLGCPHIVAAFGAFLWAFGMVHVIQLGHQQTLPRFWCPLAVYHAHRFGTNPNSRSLAWLAMCVILQATSCFYTGWFLGVGLLMFLPIHLSLREGGWRSVGQFYRTSRIAIVVIVLASVALLAAVAAPYVLANRGVSRSYRECIHHLPTVGDWFASPPDTRWAHTIAPYLDELNIERALFHGLGYLVLFGIASVWLFTRKGSDSIVLLGRASAIAAVLFVLLTLRFGDEASGWWFVRFVPGGAAIRAVSRVYAIVYLFVNVTIVVAVAQYLATERSRFARLVLFSCLGFVVFEQIGHRTPSFAKSEFYGRAEECAASLRGADVGFVTGDFGPRGFFETNLLGMWAGLRANVPVVNGYSGRAPDGYDDRQLLSEAQVHEWLAPRYRGTIRFVDAGEPKTWRSLDVP